MYVITVDQRGSRTDTDRVPELIATGSDHPGLLRPFERTAGDEVQAVFETPDALARLAVDLAVSGHWSVGIGVGDVETPLPAQTRAGRGAAFVAARDAVDAAKKDSRRLRVAGQSPWCEHAGVAGAYLIELLIDRSEAGREAVALMAAGYTQAAAAEVLGITPQAVSLRLRHARWDLEGPGLELFARLLRASDEGD
ncbi:hypothetical protein [Gordonia shandongensis]|uniref:hypothetical protein n=1 Tax=Gordonia shandongensis TaxID=376351 RepID=UPI00041A29A7|nr:hypothetical protein [Gordonia shandongensis]